MNVGLDHERVRTHRLGRVEGERVSCGRNELINLFDRRRLPQTDVVANPRPREVRLVELADFHDRSQRAMVLAKAKMAIQLPMINAAIFIKPPMPVIVRATK